VEMPTPFVLGFLAVTTWLLASPGARFGRPETFRAAARLAFGSITAALLFIGAGISGYRLSRHARFVAGSWAGEIIWWQVVVGALFIVLAAYSVRRARTLTGMTHASLGPGQS
jgi:hypothetical protein